MKRRILRMAGRPAGITLADVMEAAVASMRDVMKVVRVLEDEGRLIRSGGGPREAFRWKRAPHHA